MVISMALLSALALQENLANCDQLCRDMRERATQCAHVTEGVIYEKRANAICIRGPIAENSGAQFSTLIAFLKSTGRFDNNDKPIVVMSSPGGFAGKAMDIGDEITKNKLDVVVDGVCASACAQFLFMGGRNKFILDNGVLAFHGGPISEDTINGMPITEINKTLLNAENSRFSDFYARRGLDMRMLTEPPNHIRPRLAKGEMVFWTWSSKELESFGVKDLFTCENKG